VARAEAYVHCMPSFILIRPTVWSQYTNVTDSTDRTDKQDKTDRQTDRQTDNGLIAGRVHVRYLLSPVHLSSVVCNASAPYSGG